MKKSLTKLSIQKRITKVIRPNHLLRVGDKVMVISGGNSIKKNIKSKVGTISGFTGKDNTRVNVDGIDNNIIVHIKAKSPNEKSRKETRISSLHLSNVMFYSEKVNKPVRIKKLTLPDGKKVRGFLNPLTKLVEQI